MRSNLARCGLMFSRVLLSALVLTNPRVGSAQVPDTLPPVLLIHGFRSSASTWDNLAPLLSTAGFGRVFRTSTNAMGYIDSQKNTLVSYVGTVGIATESPILVGHRMGGLIARHLNTAVAADAVITIGAPHQGHPMLVDPFGSNQLYQIAGAIAGAAGSVYDNLWRCGQQRDSPGGMVAGPCYTIWEFMNFTGVIVGTIYAVNDLFISGGATDDMTPNSAFLQSLNGSTHVAAENASSKIAMIGQLNNYEQYQSIFRMVLGESEAADVGAYLPWFSATVQDDGWDIITEALSSDPWYWERILGGAAIVLAGIEIQNLPSTWNSLIGGWPNDGFMYIGTQSFSGATQVDAPGLSHGEETPSTILREKVIEIGAFYRRN